MKQIKKGVELLSEQVGSGVEIERNEFYQIRLQSWLNKGDPIKWDKPWGLLDRAELSDNGEVLITDVRIDREFLIAGLFYGVQGMNIGGIRKIKVSPHLAYGDRGVEGRIPENAVIIFEIEILERRFAS